MAETNRKAILAASFGTSFSGSRSITIGAIESTLAECFPGYEVRRAFTSNIIIKILKKRDGIDIPTVAQALDRLAAEGFTEVFIQPTHMMPGIEYDLIAEEAEKHRESFRVLRMGSPVLSEDEDYKRLIGIIDEDTAGLAEDGRARVFIGHGTDHAANECYTKLQKAADARGKHDIFIGTVESTPTLSDVLEAVRASGARSVLLTPLMIVAGDHANNDMTGDSDDSWKSVFEAAGFDVRCNLKGLGSIYGVQKMIADHCRRTMQKIK